MHGVWNGRRWALAALLVLAAASAGCGRMASQLGSASAEPQVTVVVDGQRRTMGLEKYLEGVVAGEMGELPTAAGARGAWPLEAYKAQAIVARSFTVAFLRGRKDNVIPADIEQAQAYKPQAVTPEIRRAVAETRGMVLTYRGEAIKTWFHAYSGGHTAGAKEGLNVAGPEPPYVQAIRLGPNPYVPADRRSWRMSVPLATVRRALASRGIDVGNIRAVTPVEKGPSGRTVRLRIVGDQGSQEIHASDFRLALGPAWMKSTLLDRMAVQGDTLVAEGRGFGHGVGLSQWDAYLLAKRGWDGTRIAEHFFRNVRVERLWR